MDILFQYISQDNSKDVAIKWYYTDYQLMIELSKLTEVWLTGKALIASVCDLEQLNRILQGNDETIQRIELKKFIQSIHLAIPIKPKGKSGITNQIDLDDNFSYEINKIGTITIKNRKMTFEIKNNKLYKITKSLYNPAMIISRLMTGDLYDCLLILETNDIDRYPEFLDYNKRLDIEAELESKIHQTKEFFSLSIGVHPILDKNKTERQLHIDFEDSDTTTIIGEHSSKKLLIGVFIKNDQFGLYKNKKSSTQKRTKLISLVSDYFASFFKNGTKQIKLYEEADLYGY
jgi:hypothetical protein